MIVYMYDCMYVCLYVYNINKFLYYCTLHIYIHIIITKNFHFQYFLTHTYTPLTIMCMSGAHINF